MFVIRRIDNNNKIKAYGYTIKKGGLGEYNESIYEEVELDNLPEGYEMEPIPKSPSIKALDISNAWALYFDNLAKTDAGIVIAYEQDCILLENALKNAGRVAELENKELDLTFVFYKISQLETKNGVNTEKLQEIKNKLIELCQV